MDPSTLVMKLILGGILGMVGQGARVVVGLKKLNDKANQQNQEFSDIFKTSTLVLSLMIGFIAGVLGVISIDMPQDDLIDKATVLTLLGIGYAGTDFIEGFLKKQPLPKPALVSISTEKEVK